MDNSSNVKLEVSLSRSDARDLEASAGPMVPRLDFSGNGRIFYTYIIFYANRSQNFYYCPWNIFVLSMSSCYFSCENYQITCQHLLRKQLIMYFRQFSYYIVDFRSAKVDALSYPPRRPSERP